MPIATDPVTMLPDKLARRAAVATLFLKYGNKVGETTNDTVAEEAEVLASALEKLAPHYLAFQIVHHDRTVHHR